MSPLVLDARTIVASATPCAWRDPGFGRNEGVCPKCGKTFALEAMQADHITPWSKGGRTAAENCQMLCADCNRRKSDV